eukprot:gnl/MRDRNA2_/MRDRNA2_109650_c0_seq1.p1 gnl/MRDRNA2_/MRDRNA2_109650_c0~~gnl/MRDRNA2_/MRDRNA2_109650_c0_seq1.p1  ORF type:complete len:326 (-),score=43.04 gnl/MRDRNA2_/MRDRNA2_109650_c0_seq1:215-1192(-)
MQSQVSPAMADLNSDPLNGRGSSLTSRISGRLAIWFSRRPNEPWVCVFLSRMLCSLNAVLLCTTVYICAQQNQLVASTPNRHWAWPWSSCFDTLCPDEECCSQFLVDEWSLMHFSHGYVLYYWLLVVPVRNLLFPLVGIFLDPTDFDYLGLNLVVLIEVMWEAYENSPDVLEQTSAEAYTVYRGDSGLNVLGDVLMCVFGFTAMHMGWMYCFDHSGFRIPFTMAVFYSFAMTTVLYVWFCDGFVLIWLNMSQLRRKDTCDPRFPDFCCAVALSIIAVTVIIPLYAKYAFKYELEALDENASGGAPSSPQEQRTLPAQNLPTSVPA